MDDSHPPDLRPPCAPEPRLEPAILMDYEGHRQVQGRPGGCAEPGCDEPPAALLFSHTALCAEHAEFYGKVTPEMVRRALDRWLETPDLPASTRIELALEAALEGRLGRSRHAPPRLRLDRKAWTALLEELRGEGDDDPDPRVTVSNDQVLVEQHEGTSEVAIYATLKGTDVRVGNAQLVATRDRLVLIGHAGRFPVNEWVVLYDGPVDP